MLNVPAISQSSTGNNLSNPLISGSQQYTVSVHNSEELIINNTGDGDSVSLSYTSTTSYRESMFTVGGQYGSPGKQGINSEVIQSGAGSNATGGAQSLSSVNQMMEHIQGRVFFLLRSFVEQLTGEESKSFLPSQNNVVNLESTTVSAPSLQAFSLNLTRQHSVEISSVSTDRGYNTAENTADRIIQFALSFYDGRDRQEYAEMASNAVMKGFSQAMYAFGGELPAVSHQTIGIVKSALEKFAAGDNINISA